MSRRTWQEEDLIKFVKESDTKSEVIRKLGLKVRPGNFRTIDSYIEKLKLDCSHFKGKAHGRSVSPKRIDTEKILVKDSKYKSPSGLKRRILTEKLLKEECKICGLKPMWQNKKLILILDHINGVNNDNRIENLRFLCPNCDSQQETFAGRNKNRSGSTPGGSTI